MNFLLVATASILVLTGLAWAAGKSLRFPVCPVCVGVSGTWMWMLGARLAGFGADATILATLLGGSVVGVAFQLEKRLRPGRSPLLWKALFLPVGFIAAYGLAVSNWGLAAAAIAVLLILAAAFVLPSGLSRGNEAVVDKLEEHMKKCC